MSLLELLVALAIMGVLAGVVGFAMDSPPSTNAARRSDAVTAIAAARRHAIDSAVSVRVVVACATHGADSVVALPNGSVVGADACGFDPLTGRWSDVSAREAP